MTDKTALQISARNMLVRALWELRRYSRGTVGERAVIERDLPLAIQAMIHAEIDAVLEEAKTEIEHKRSGTA